MDEIILDYLLEDHLDLNIVQIVVDQYAEPGDVIAPQLAVPTFNEAYVENVVPNYSLCEFKSHFRMSRNAVIELCAQLVPHLHERHLFITLEKKVLFFIWIIAKQESFLAASDRFGFAKGTGHYIFMKILSAIVQLKEQFIQWPNERECTEIANRIERRYHIPGVVGAIDGCHISIKQPTNNAIDFYNRKEYHSIILQAVCDDRRILTDVFIGMPGRVHDARVFRNSPLYDKLLGNPPLLPAGQHIIGDAAYPLLANLLKPYRDNGHLTARQSRYNEIFSSQRSVIERTFALLLGKWRRLKYLDMSLANKVPEVILAACILHNFLLKRQQEAEDDYEDNDDDYEDNDILIANNNENDELAQDDINNSGALKRDYIAMLL